MRHFSNLLIVLVVGLMMIGCNDKVDNPNKNLQLQDYESLDSSLYALNSRRIREHLSQMVKADKDSLMADFKTKSYFLHEMPFVWINRHGVNPQVDILLTYLRSVDEMGFSLEKFKVPEIEEDIKRLRNLDVDSDKNNINTVAARLEYNLTKAYLRYTGGQRFGFMNPTYVFNRIDVKSSDSTRVTYRGLFDIPMEKPGKQFYDDALGKVSKDSVAEFLHDIQPKSKLYSTLKERLKTADTNELKSKILCNMERCRWRLHDYPQNHKKYVIVNIPSFHLRAVDGDSTLEMRVGVGSFETKTPLLTSEIMRMDVNPQWFIPRSIIESSVIHHVGNRGYWARQHFLVKDRKTGKEVPFHQITWSMLNSTDYYVIQQGGIGNSLGRIIFRFDNNFSVYLHDTNQAHVFSREDRGVSHGCVRVEKPFELAKFMLSDKDEKLIEKIKYSMSAAIGGEDTTIPKEQRIKSEAADTLRRDMMINSVKVDPKVPIFITYFTLYPDKEGNIQSYSDVYGYDKQIYLFLRNYR